MYKVIVELIKAKGVQIRTVYSNTSPFGLFRIGPYPVDLAIVTADGRLFLFQMDGVWAHGCDVCPVLSSYVGGQTHAQVRQATKERDEAIQHWISSIHAPVFYTVICNGHVPDFTASALSKWILKQPELKHLVSGYTLLDTLGQTPAQTQLLDVLQWHKNDASFTFIAKVSVAIVSDCDGLLGPLILYQDRENMYTRQTLGYKGEIVLTRDYYAWLIDTFGSQLVIETVHWILFYATEPMFNSIYDALVTLRSSSQDPAFVSFLKRIMNLSCGFYGAHSVPKEKSSFRLVNKLPYTCSLFHHVPDIQHIAITDSDSDRESASFFLLETKSCHKNKIRPICKSALPMFLAVVEFGKKRLVEIIHFLQKHCRPHSFRLLYSNVDNIVFALANANTLQEAIAPHYRKRFNEKASMFVLQQTPDSSTTATPGVASVKWIRNGSCGWKFISIRTQHYCVIVTEPLESGCDNDIHKTSGWSNVSSRKAFEAAQAILQGQQVSMPQMRRVNKKASMEMSCVQFKY